MATVFAIYEYITLEITF